MTIRADFPAQVATDLPALLHARATAEPDRTALTFLTDGDGEADCLSRAELDRRSRAVAVRLAESGLAGERVLLLLPPGLEYVASFLGCLYAGAVAVPVYPPTGSRGLPRLKAIFEDCRPAGLITVRALETALDRLGEEVPAFGELPRLVADRFRADADLWTPPALTPDSLAFLQYTSGSTSTPKGVMVTHGNLTANQEMIREAFRTHASSVVVSWLPLYHDMGLIGGLLHPLYLGARCVLLSPLHFLQRPARWLRAISRHRATVSGGPNFAYDLCARRVRDLAPHDLTTWEVAFNGAEPVRAATLERFSARFADDGFDPGAFFPCYGLAEATLLVSGGRREAEVRTLPADPDHPEESPRLVSSGRVPAAVEVRVVDPETGLEMPPGREGEVWVAGAGVAAGYWRRPEAAAETFGARLAGPEGGDEEGDTYLRTGDLGRLEDGELYVTGRIKDLIIIRGRNLYPQDVEETAEAAHPGVRAGSGAAFTITQDEDGGQGEERLAVVYEVRAAAKDLDEVREAVCRAVAEEHEVAVSELALVRGGSVPKTTSGKIQRRACRALYLAGELPVLLAWTEAGSDAEAGEGGAGLGAAPKVPPRTAPRTRAEARLARLWEEVLERPAGSVGVEESFFALGGDSLRGSQLIARIADETGVEIGLEELFHEPTVAALAAGLEKAGAALDGADASDSCASPEGAVGPLAPGVGEAGEGAAPLSSPQRRLWFLDQMEPGNPAYNLGVTAVFSRGPSSAGAGESPASLDVRALAEALCEVVRRQEALRTVFAVEGGEPVQRPLPAETFLGAGPAPLPVVDLSGLEDGSRDELRRSLARGWVRRRFDLAAGPPFRALLLRWGASEAHFDEVELCLALHHIVGDAWSIAVLLRELTTSYAARVGGGDPSAALPKLPVQYRDYVAWQARRLEGGALDDCLAGWKERLAGDLPILELPLDRPRPPLQSYDGAHAVHRLSPELREGLEALGGEHRASLYMVLLAGFQALLHHRTGQRDVMVGTAVANRERPELEGLVGFFINTLPLRGDLSGNPAFRELLDRSRSTVLAALAGREVPFERLVEETAPARDLSRTPLVQVMLVLQNAPLAVPPPPGLRLAMDEVDGGTARFDLAVSVVPRPGRSEAGPEGSTGGLDVVLKYRTDLFDATTMARLGAAYETLLRAAVADPGLRLAELPVLRPAERHQVTAEWNAPPAVSETVARLVPPAGGTLHGIFEARADEHPDRVAVTYEGDSLSYGELDRRAEALARRLRGLGVGPETPVAVAMDRSAELMTALFAVLKAGGAYVPLDPSYPEDRLAWMLADSGAPVVLTQEHLADSLPPSSTEVLILGPDAGAEAGAAGRLSVDLHPESAAYAIYTSGSTGRPKGVLVPHRGITNRLSWMQDAYRLRAGETVLQKTPLSFDVSVWELFWPLLAGARLVLARPGGHQDTAYLADVIAAERVTTLHFVPSMLQVFLEEPRIAGLGSLARVIASGEALPRELAERFAERLGWAALHNLYGPTEASVDVTYWACRPQPEGAPVPIGRPISGLRIHILDPSGRPAAPGVVGHLHIGGVGLARGYLGRPALTAERFVPDPFAGPFPGLSAGGGARLAGSRFYGTGDLARTRPDGEIEFAGRTDHQVKVRGFRIELGEIEAALCALPGVRESVVTARTSASGATRLAAYVVTTGEAAFEAVSVAARLGRRLPEYMVPSTFTVLPALPLTPSGKVDRKALPAPGGTVPGQAGDEVGADSPGSAEGMASRAPQGPVEERLATLWERQLGSKQLGGDARGGIGVGADDDFFALGGDSIQGALLINELQRELGAVIYVMSLFDHPTVSRFARYLEESYGTALVAAGWLEADERAEADAADSLSPEEEEAAFDRALVGRFSPAQGGADAEAGPNGAKNRRAVFILSPFRSGSTLLRVMLEGHPELFAPPELELLGFRTMGERARAFSGRDRFAREGLLRAVMELLSCDADSAEAVVAEAEARDEAVSDFYGRLQGWAGGRLLVDKTPRYALDAATLARAESYFEEPLYIHLTRHPLGTLRSYLDARMHEVYRFPLSPERGAELVWRRSHANVLRALEGVPAERRIRLPFEELVGDPEAAVERLCAFLGVEPDPAMLNPYQGGRMTDGLHREGRMMGDPKFHRHRRIEASAAERWRERPVPELDAATWELAAELGYEAPQGEPPREVSPEPVLAPVPRSPGEPDPRPLSFGQQRLWFLHRLEGGAGAYGMPAAVRLTGRLNVRALTRAAAAVEERHEVLRTVFPAAAGRARQQVRPPRASVPLPVVDLRALDGRAADGEAERCIDEELHRGFDLAEGPLWRLRLLRLPSGEPAGSEHILLVHLHHIVADGWSIGVLTRELAALYGARLREEPSPLSPLPLQYADFAAWQREYLSGRRLTAHLDYWRERLKGLPPLLELPTDRPRPAVQSYRGERLPVVLPAELVGRLRGAGRAAGATLFMVLVAAFQTLLGRWAGQDDVALGTPAANRDRPEVEGLIGPFVNTLVLRGNLGGDPTAGALLAATRESAVGAARHGDLPFEKLVEELGVPRSLAHAPLFTVMLALQNAPGAPLELPGLDAERLSATPRSAKFDLTLDLTSAPDGTLTGALEYAVDLFDRSTVRRLAGQLAVLAGAFADALLIDETTGVYESGAASSGGLYESGAASSSAAPESGQTGVYESGADSSRGPESPGKPGVDEVGGTSSEGLYESGAASPRGGVRISALPVLTPAERQALTVEAADTAAPYAAELPLHRLILEGAERWPDRVAVRRGAESLSYGALAVRTTSLARRLVALGVGPEDRVAIYAERSVELPAALLAVLAAGGAYVPLDPAYPKSRVATILEDSGASLLLTESALVPDLPETAVPVLALDEPPSRSALEGGTAALPSPHPESLAYLIYTSGSTGKPKGVGVPHRTVINYLTSMARDLAPDPREDGGTLPGIGFGEIPASEAPRSGISADASPGAMLALTTVSFDIAVTELYLPLALGARVEMVDRETAGDASRLAGVLAASGVTVMQATPATYRLLLDGGWEGDARLTALCGGEALPPALASRLAPRVGRLWNVYGPTETTVWSSRERISPARTAEGASDEPVPVQVQVGRPLANTSIHVLGPRGEELPAGAVGELVIGGEGVARGYHRRPALTAERFVPAVRPFTATRSSAATGGERAYRTGDLGRRLPDGRLECLGRLDHQVKVRGFRIELGEIEAALAAHPAVAAAVVRPWGEGTGLRLWAYAVRAPARDAEGGTDEEIAWSRLRSDLAERLPLPMVPSGVTFLGELPLLPSGKVNRRALPEPGRDRPELGASFVAPRNHAERVVAEVWKEVLGIDRVGVNDNFFDLGGHSLLAAEVHGKLVEGELEARDLTLLDLFRHTTVGALAARLAAPGGAEDDDLEELREKAARGRGASRKRRRALARRRGGR